MARPAGMDDAGLDELLTNGARALGTGDMVEAIDRYTRALSIRADLPDVWYNLAWAQRAARRFEDALESYARAVAHGMKGPEDALINSAAILSDHLFRRDDAVHQLEAALACNPESLPAWLSLGLISEDVGDADGARAAYERALALAPGNGRAVARLAALAVLTGEPDAAVGAIERSLPAAATPTDRSEMLFALGTACDAAGHYAAAFTAISEANRLAATIAPRGYDAAAMERLVDRMIAAFPIPVPPAPAVSDGAAPIFICGMFRSGSTLFEQVLARHSRVTAGGELEFIPALAQQWPDYPEEIRRAPAERLAALRRAYRAELPPGEIVTDKRCDNFLHIGLIRSLFPDAPIVHTRRQPLDTLLSIYFLPFGDGVTYDTDLAAAAHHYLQYRRMMAHWRRVFPDAIVDTDYDRLVATPDAEVGALLDRLGLPREPACLDPAASGAVVRTASNWQVRQALHARSSGRWQHYRDQLAGVAERLAAAGLDPSRP